ncbi:carotenoid oxygenase family protein [Glycomyces albidus]|uniref:Dioxygenase n=1 Tax=Glycomyces albidus TaxID=2656774 RepID=A0A6L5G521_9ACTN|nr:carotenoid oxygenase family protein [Glycomyces albidus]MQM24730.1 carotenoid oxygenase [Glycomyces albidus]
MNLTRYTRGNFAPVTEETTAFDLPVTGAVPHDLNGRYLRIGPNPLGIEDPAAHIWTLGEGMVHGVRLREGRAEWYRNRWVRSASVADRLGEPRRGHPVDERFDFAPNVQVAGHGGRFYALIEGGLAPYELTGDLDTVGPCDLGATPEGFNANAHTKFDHRTGEMHSLSFRYGADFIQHIVFEPGGTVRRTTNIPAPTFPYLHDFGLTDDHVLIYTSPLVFDPELLATGVPFGWNDDLPTRLGVMPREGGEVRWMDLPPGMVGHTLNAYEENGAVVADVIVHPGRFEIVDIGAGRPVLERWTVDLAAGKVRTELLHDRPQDFPRLNGRYAGRPYRYGYSASTELYAPPSVAEPDRPDAGFSNAVLKHDLVAGTTEAHEFGRDAAAGETVFVPAAQSKAEDDGYNLLFVHDPERGAADLVILAAQDFTGAPLARIHLPVRVPLGLHGNWIPEAS